MKPFIIFYLGKFPVQTIYNARGPQYSVCPLDTASRFETEDAAAQAAARHGVQTYTIGEELTSPPPDREASDSETVAAASRAALFQTSNQQPR